MKFYFKHHDYIFLAAVAVIVIACVAYSASATDTLSRALGVSIALLIVIALGVESTRRIQQAITSSKLELIQNQNNVFSQVESVIGIYHSIRPTAPLPATRGWAASPDFLIAVRRIAIESRPRLVVEASSGVSTLMLAYCAKQCGSGKVISLEHDQVYRAKTLDALDAHGLSEYAEVVYAPLRDYEINGETWKWYDVDSVTFDSPIDLIIVDGPPRSTQHLARYPALPILAGHSSERLNVIMDDGDRDDEKQISEQWYSDFDFAKKEYLSLEKGAFLLRMNAEL